MSKFIHVDSDDGSMQVVEKQAAWYQSGWCYKVPDDFKLVIPLDKMGEHLYIYELLEDHDDAELVFQGDN